MTPWGVGLKRSRCRECGCSKTAVGITLLCTASVTGLQEYMGTMKTAVGLSPSSSECCDANKLGVWNGEDSGGILAASSGCCGTNELGVWAQRRQRWDSRCFVLGAAGRMSLGEEDRTPLHPRSAANPCHCACQHRKWRGQEEVVTVHTWASVVVELAWPSSTGSSSCR